MYKKRNKAESMFDFNGAFGLKLNEDNKWVKKAKMIPWDEIEEKNKTHRCENRIVSLRNHLLDQ